MRNTEALVCISIGELRISFSSGERRSAAQVKDMPALAATHICKGYFQPLSVATDFSEDNQASPDYLDKTVRKMGLQRMSGYSGLYC